MLSGMELHLCLPPRPRAIKHVTWWWPSLTAQPGWVHMSQGQRGCGRAMGVGQRLVCNQRWSQDYLYLQ